MSEACSVGSYAMGLVEEFGSRKPGQCPALTQTEKGFECGVILEPKRWLKRHDKRASVHQLRQAMLVCTGAGTACDSIGDGPGGPHDDFLLRQVQMILKAKYSEKQIRDGVSLLCGG